jgi:hypothetical protein
MAAPESLICVHLRNLWIKPSVVRPVEKTFPERSEFKGWHGKDPPPIRRVFCSSRVGRRAGEAALTGPRAAWRPCRTATTGCMPPAFTGVDKRMKSRSSICFCLFLCVVLPPLVFWRSSTIRGPPAGSTRDGPRPDRRGNRGSSVVSPVFAASQDSRNPRTFRHGMFRLASRLTGGIARCPTATNQGH